MCDEVHIIQHCPNGHSSYHIKGVYADFNEAMDDAYQLAREKFRYSGPRQVRYSYFDQTIKVSTWPVTGGEDAVHA